jgi:regulator of extracellular matrix RemA (YlzA/DUF370 family)
MATALWSGGTDNGAAAGREYQLSESGIRMEGKLLNIGFGNTVVADRVVAIVSPGSAPMKRLKEDAKMAKKLIDATMGRRTRAIIITDSNHIILSGVQAETIAQRFMADSVSKDGDSKPK